MTALTLIPPSTIEEVRQRVGLSGLIAHRVKLARAGRGWKGLCPFHLEKTASFTVTDEKGFYHCHGCGAHGDAFRWVQEIDGVSFREAVLRLAADAGVTIPDAAPSGPSAALDGRLASAVAPVEVALDHPVFDCVSSATAGRWIWNGAGPARGEIVETYLASRGLDPLAAFDGEHCAIDSIRFHPRCPVSAWRVDDDPGAARLTAPAMIAPIGDAAGARWGVHVTFLASDGRSKAKLPLVRGKERPTRKIFGQVGGHAVFLTPAEAMCSPAPLIVGEGLETTWSFAQSLGRPCRVAAALSLENLQGGQLRLADGTRPMWNVRSDPDRAPFLLDDAGEVVVAVDADMKALRGQRLQLTRGAKPVTADINGLQRAELCASLAVQAWRRAGASKVSAVRPRVGQDFNDAAQAA